MEEHFHIQKIETPEKIIYELRPKSGVKKTISVGLGTSSEAFEEPSRTYDLNGIMSMNFEETKKYLRKLATQKEKDIRYVSLITNPGLDRLQTLVAKTADKHFQYQQRINHQLMKIINEMKDIVKMKPELQLLINGLKPIEYLQEPEDGPSNTYLKLDANNLLLDFEYNKHDLNDMLNKNNYEVTQIVDEVNDLFERNSDLRSKVNELEDQVRSTNKKLKKLKKQSKSE